MDGYGLIPNAYQGVYEGLKFLQHDKEFDRTLAEKHWESIQATELKKQELGIRQQQYALDEVKFDLEKNQKAFDDDVKIYRSLDPLQADDWAQKKLATIDREKQPVMWDKYNALATGGRAVADDIVKQNKVIYDLKASGKYDVKNLLAAQAAATTKAGKEMYKESLDLMGQIEATRQKALVTEKAKIRKEGQDRDKKVAGYRKRLSQLELAYENLKKGLTLKQQAERMMLPGKTGLERPGDKEAELRGVQEEMTWLRRKIMEEDPTNAGGQSVLDFNPTDLTFAPMHQ